MYNKFKVGQLDGTAVIDFDTDTIHVALVNSGYVANTSAQDVHDFFDDVAVSEVTGSGYTAGGQALTTKSVTLDTAGDRGYFDANDTVWSTSTITAYGAVLYKRVGTTNSVSPVIGLIDFGGAQVSATGAFTITWSGAGILQLS